MNSFTAIFILLGAMVLYFLINSRYTKRMYNRRVILSKEWLHPNEEMLYTLPCHIEENDQSLQIKMWITDHRILWVNEAKGKKLFEMERTKLHQAGRQVNGKEELIYVEDSEGDGYNVIVIPSKMSPEERETYKQFTIDFLDNQ